MQEEWWQAGHCQPSKDKTCDRFTFGTVLFFLRFFAGSKSRLGNKREIGRRISTSYAQPRH